MRDIANGVVQYLDIAASPLLTGASSELDQSSNDEFALD